MKFDTVMAENKSFSWFAFKFIFFLTGLFNVGAFYSFWMVIANRSFNYFLITLALGIGVILLFKLSKGIKQEIINLESWERKYLYEKIVNEIIQQDLSYAKLHQLHREVQMKTIEWNKQNPKERFPLFKEVRKFESIANQAIEIGHYSRLFGEKGTQKPTKIKDE